MRTLRPLPPVSLAHCVRRAIPASRLVLRSLRFKTHFRRAWGLLVRRHPYRYNGNAGDGRPPRFLGNPRDGSPGSWTPVGPTRQAVTACRHGPRLCQQRGLPTRKLSRLDVQAFRLTVYASSGGSPHHGARLASGDWLGPAGWDWLPTGLLRKVSKIRHLILLS